MPELTHEHLVRSLKKPGAAIAYDISANEADVLHMVLGVAGESGEIVDLLKKTIIYGKPLDREKLELELGDLEFYLEGLRQAVGLTRESILKKNIKKLTKRYAGMSYSDQAAIERVDV
jgi:NTP pyrophosphatase (non-canonical NTP hydrolase)